MHAGLKQQWSNSDSLSFSVGVTDDGLDEEFKPEEFVTYLEKTWIISDIIKSEIKQEAK